MTPSQEITLTLFTKETLAKVKDQFKSKTERVPHESFDMSFRLFRTNAGNINLEILVQMELPDQNSEVDFGSFGKARTSQHVMFFKPIGYYKVTNGFFSDKLEVTVVNEFEQGLDYLNSNNLIPSNLTVHKMTFLENAILTAFSMEALIRAVKYEDSSFYANGLKADLFMSFDGYPQVFLDDRYNFPGPIAAYMLRERNAISPILEYEDIFDKFHQMSLMTAFKKI